MMKRILLTAALIVPLAPAIAAAQTAMPDPAVPGSGYQIPEVHTATRSMTSAEAADPSIPGDGYRISGGSSPTAPAAPVTNQDGSYPSHWIQQ
ncbi:MAG TPA: hypothetical protein VMI56_00485 [Reyranella sp.]|nr:hypothetical protein [Reyranella sp.]